MHVADTACQFIYNATKDTTGSKNYLIMLARERQYGKPLHGIVFDNQYI